MMNNQTLKEIFVILFMALLLYAHGGATNVKKKKGIFLSKINFETQVKMFCENKPRVNFCSQEQIDIMLAIERRRLETVELARQLKRMESEIIRKVFNATIFKNVQRLNAIS